jgi:alpha-beta hydrolase superfamily lysophospholipase
MYIVHGMSEHSSRYHSFATDIATRLKINVIGNDHRGHGMTSCPDGLLTNLGVFEKRSAAESMDPLTVMAHDTLNVISSREMDRDLPIILFGHSMGSIVARLILRHADRSIQTQVRSVILSGVPTPVSGYEYYPLMGIGRAIKLARGIGHEFVQKNFVTGKFDKSVVEKTGIDLGLNGFVSSDPQSVHAYNADPFCGHLVDVDILMSIAKNLGLLKDAKKFFEPLGDLKLKFLLISGRHDPVCEFGKTAASVAAQMALIGHSVTELYLSNCRHEFLNEITDIRDAGVNQIVAWLGTSLGF